MPDKNLIEETMRLFYVSKRSAVEPDTVRVALEHLARRLADWMYEKTLLRRGRIEAVWVSDEIKGLCGLNILKEDPPRC